MKNDIIWGTNKTQDTNYKKTPKKIRSDKKNECPRLNGFPSDATIKFPSPVPDSFHCPQNETNPPLNFNFLSKVR